MRELGWKRYLASLAFWWGLVVLLPALTVIDSYWFIALWGVTVGSTHDTLTAIMLERWGLL